MRWYCNGCSLAALGLLLLVRATVSIEDYDDYYDVEVNSSSVTPTVTVPSSPSITPTSTPTSSSTVGPTPTPSPSPPKSQYNLKNNANSSEVCFNMSADITVLINTTTAKKVNITYLSPTDFSDGRVLNISTCNSSNLTAMIYIQKEEWSNITLTLNFTGDTNRDQWNLAEMGFILGEEFMNVSSNETVAFKVGKDHFDPYYQGVGFQRFFRCKAQNISFWNASTTPNPMQFVPEVQLRNVSMQVFRFRNMTTGEMINGVTCEADSDQGSTVVPIAVGVALACLVIIVLIAYLIGRFKGRRQSYEPLS